MIIIITVVIGVLLSSSVFAQNKVNRQLAVEYGYISEKDLLYAVDHFESENNDFCNYANVFALIKGWFSGVTISSNSVHIRGGNNSFTPGASDALYEVDFQNTSSIDCKAAIYGIKGGNGGVIVATYAFHRIRSKRIPTIALVKRLFVFFDGLTWC